MTIKFIAPGKRFNRFTLLEDIGVLNGLRRWRVQCDCGNVKICEASAVARGHTKSCGCLKAESAKKPKYKVHGMCGTSTYRSWTAMHSRCRDPRKPDYHGKGITVCDRWSKFENFLADMGERPDGMTIDRIDSSGNYEPSNCKWSTNKEQHRNTSRNLLISHNGETRTLAGWAEATGIGRATIKARISRGWSISESLTKEVRPY